MSDATDNPGDPAAPRSSIRRLQKYLLAGLLVWLPLGVTILILRFAVELMDRSLGLIPGRVRSELVIPFVNINVTEIPGIGFALTVIILLITGVLTTNLIGSKMVAFGESLLERIPLVRSIYSAVKNFAEIVLGPGGQSFKKVLLIQYPRKGVWSLAFQTSTFLGEIQSRTDPEVVCTFVPTTPNPTSGFIIMVPREEVIELEMDVDEALKMIISLGVVVPQWHGDKPPASLAQRPASP